MPRPTCSRHQSTGADAHRERVNTPATRDPRREGGQHHVRSASIAELSRVGGEQHARDRREIGEFGGGKGRDGW